MTIHDDLPTVSKIAQAAIEEVERLRDMHSIMVSRTSLHMLARGYLQNEAEIARLTKDRDEWKRIAMQLESEARE